MYLSSSCNCVVGPISGSCLINQFNLEGCHTSSHVPSIYWLHVIILCHYNENDIHVSSSKWPNMAG